MSLHLFRKLRRLLPDKTGQDLIEYALIVALIAFAAAAGMTSVASTNVSDKVTTYTS
jgi:pilus assembly protein Flp/PilA